MRVPAGPAGCKAPSSRWWRVTHRHRSIRRRSKTRLQGLEKRGLFQRFRRIANFFSACPPSHTTHRFGAPGRLISAASSTICPSA
jgi:hypothetical protein